MASYIMDIINARIKAGAPMSLTRILEKEIAEWKASEQRDWIIKGQEYYGGKQDILEAYRYTIGKNGAKKRLDNLPNAHIVDNQFSIAVDKKVNYSFGQPFTVKVADGQETVQKAIAPYLNLRFMRTLRKVALDAITGGVGYLSPYYNEHGQFCIKRMRAEDVRPYYSDEEKEIVDAYLYRYEIIEYVGEERKTRERYEFVSLKGVMLFEDREGHLHKIEEHSHFRQQEGNGAVTSNWTRVPLIPFRYNDQEQGLLQRVKSLQDAINTILSTFQNNMEEDARNTILVLHNYDGTDIGEFREILAQIGVVKVADDETRKGGVDTLNIEVNAENYKAILSVLKAALIENSRSYDGKDERISSGEPNQLKIKSMLLDMETDADGIETEFQPALQSLLWFILQDAGFKAKRDIGSEEDIEFEFNRDNLISETEVIANIRASEGLLSRRTLLEQHPWVDDVEEELKRLEEDEERAVESLLNSRELMGDDPEPAPDEKQK